MEKAKPQAKPQPKAEDDILSIYDLDTVLKIAAKSKQQIARGECYTPEQARAITSYYATALKSKNENSFLTKVNQITNISLKISESVFLIAQTSNLLI